MKYQEITKEQAPAGEYFFAFNKEQFERGLDEVGIRGQEICHGGSGMYGTEEGIRKFHEFYKDRRKRIANECDPQEVYDYEFINHECGYQYDDTEAIEIVVQYFGKERAKGVKRKYAYVSVDEIKEERG